MRKIVFQADIDSKNAQKELDKLNKEIAKSQEKLYAAENKKSAIEVAMEKANRSVDAARENLERMQRDMEAKQAAGVNTSALESRIAGKKAELNEDIKAAERLGREYLKADENVQKITEDLNKQKAAAGKLETQVQQTYDPAKLKEAMNGVQTSLKGGFKTILKYGLGIRSLYILFRKLRSIISDGVKEFAKYDPTTGKALTNLKNEFTKLKASLTSAFVPLLQTAEPILTKLMGWFSKLIEYVGKFFAALSGKKTFTKAVASEQKYADALKETGKEAKKTTQYLSGLDELRTYDTQKDEQSAAAESGSGIMTGVEEVSIPAWMLKIGEWVQKVKTWLSDASTFTKAKLSEIGKWFQEKFAVIKEHWGWIGDVVMTVWDSVLKPVGLAIWEFLKKWWEWLKTAYGWVYENIIKNQIEFFKNLFNVLGDLLGKLWGWYKETVTNIVEHLKNTWETIKLIVTNFPEFMAGVWQNIKDKAVAFWNRAKPWIAEALKNGGKNASEAVANAIANIKDKLAQGIQNAKQKLEDAKNTVTTWAGNIKQNAVQAFENIKTSILDKVDAIKNGIKSKFDYVRDIIANAIERIKSLFNFSFEIPHIKVPRIETVPWKNVLGVEIPRFEVHWDYLAKGGILDGATWLGGNKIAGEAGKEAVIPLERNTEWIDKIADRIADILVDRLGSIIASYPLPAVASGTLLPPRIEVEIDGLDGVAKQLDTIINSISRQRGGNYNFTAQINRKTLFNEVIAEAKVQQSANGRNPFELR